MGQIKKEGLIGGGEPGRRYDKSLQKLHGYD